MREDSVTPHLDPGHGDGGGSGLGHKAERWAPLHQVFGVGHEHATIWSKHEVLSEGIH